MTLCHVNSIRFYITLHYMLVAFMLLECLPWTVLHCYRVTYGIMYCISLAIPSCLSQFPSLAVGTNWPFCVDVPLNNQSMNSAALIHFFCSSSVNCFISVHEQGSLWSLVCTISDSRLGGIPLVLLFNFLGWLESCRPITLLSFSIFVEFPTNLKSK